jgi:Carboxypeptidase regulatory-like domain
VNSKDPIRILPIALSAILIALAGVATAAAQPASGRLTGMLTDRVGKPLVGAEIAIVGPGITRRVELVLTDAHGRFVASDLEPGRYSLRVIATKLARNGVEIQPGQVSQLSLILNTVLPALRPHAGPVLTPPSDDWKWILRTSASVRPILRYRTPAPGDVKTPLEPSQELVAMIPTPEGASALSDQVSLGNVLAYWRPLSSSTDVLVASSMAAQGVASYSELTSFRRQNSENNGEELTFIVHQLNLAGPPAGIQGAPAAQDISNARGLTLSYVQSRELSGKLELSTGFEVNYLDSWHNAMTALPRAEVEYRLSPASKIKVRYGAVTPSTDTGTVAGKVAALDTFPRLSMQGFAPRLESARHSEVSYSRRLGKKTQVEAAAYHDGFTNAVVRGTGPAAAWGQWFMAGDVMPNGVGMSLNAGNYGATGVRASVSRSLGDHLSMEAAYASGDSLELAPLHPGATRFASLLRSGRSQSATAMLIAQLPETKTRLVASYDWLQPGSLTPVDPFGLADLNAAPFAGVEIRQTVPTGRFLSGAHVEAVAEFRNAARQGYVRVVSSSRSPLTLTPDYQSVCGGFSVQF